MANFGTLTAEIDSGSLRHRSKFQRVSCLGFVTAATSLTGGQPNFARCLAVSWIGTVYIHIWTAVAPGRNFARCKISLKIFTLRPSLAFFYIGSVTAPHLSSRRQPNFATWYREWNYKTFAGGATYIQLGGQHIGRRPTF